MMVMTAVGGDNQTTTVMGRERYGVSVRYARDYREDLPALRRVLLPLPGGQGQIPMEEIATVELVQGPSMIRDENGLLAGYVYVDFDTSKIDVGSYVEEAKKAVAAGVKLPTGYSLAWSGQYENMLRVKERLKLILPLTLVLIFALLYMNTKSAVKASIVMLAVPFSAIGAVWLLWFLGYNVSIAVWVGMIALMGLDAETGVFMLLFLDLSHDEARAAGQAPRRARPGRGHHPRRGEAGPAQGHDRLRRHDRPAAHHVVHRHRRRPDEAHRRPHGRRPGHQLPHGAAGLPGRLLPLEAARVLAASPAPVTAPA